MIAPPDGTMRRLIAWQAVDITRHLDAAVPRDRLARLRIALTYGWRHRRLPDLVRPLRFTELVQQRKLVDRNPLMPLRADKLAAKAFVARTIGNAYVVPTLWSGELLPDVAPWPRPFVAKTRHGCNDTAFVAVGTEWGTARERVNRAARSCYGGWLDEWAYTQIARGVLVEPHIGDPATLPVDYKFYVFHGRVGAIQVHLDRARNHHWLLFDRHWRRLSAANDPDDPSPPVSLTAMIDIAERLGAGFDFVRVDLYEDRAQPLFGEMTFYPGSGLDRFDPPELDLALGALWRG